MAAYRFSGEIELGKGKHGFEREVEADSEDQAEDLLYAELGSEHSINRGKIDIEEVEEA